jgi:regulator of sigma E protease
VRVSFFNILAGILGLGLLVIVHEAGHLLAARASGMHVLRFSLGIGPALFSYQSKRSGTIYRVGAIPFLAYVQIAGMNPFEEIDPEDKTSYANGSLFARVFAILAGPLANYVFASVLFFICYAVGGAPSTKPLIEVAENSPAQAAQMKTGDLVLAIGGNKVDDWMAMREQIVKSPGKPLLFDIQRGKERLQLTVTPKNDKNEGRIGVGQVSKIEPVSIKEAGVMSLVMPYTVVKNSIIGLARVITLKDKPDFGGPVRIVNETSKAAKDGWLSFVFFLGVLSAYLGGFNALPFPALDGGRLAFLGYEAITRRKPNARIEVVVHALGFAMLLTLIAVVTFSDTKKVINEHSEGPASSGSAAPAKKPR